MIYLQSKEQFNQFAMLNIKTGEAQYKSKDNLIEGRKVLFSGVFSEVDDEPVFFFAMMANCF